MPQSNPLKSGRIVAARDGRKGPRAFIPSSAVCRRLSRGGAEHRGLADISRRSGPILIASCLETGADSSLFAGRILNFFPLQIEHWHPGVLDGDVIMAHRKMAIGGGIDPHVGFNGGQMVQARRRHLRDNAWRRSRFWLRPDLCPFGCRGPRPKFFPTRPVFSIRSAPPG